MTVFMVGEAPDTSLNYGCPGRGDLEMNKIYYLKYRSTVSYHSTFQKASPFFLQDEMARHQSWAN